MNFYFSGIFNTNSLVFFRGNKTGTAKIDYVFAGLKIYDDHLSVFQSKQLLRLKYYTISERKGRRGQNLSNSMSIFFCNENCDEIDWEREDDEIVKCCGQSSVLLEKD